MQEFGTWVRKIPWRKKWKLTPVFLPRKSHRQRSLTGYSPWGCSCRIRHDLATKCVCMCVCVCVSLGICMHMHAFNMHKGCDWFSHTKPLVKKILVFYASALLSLFSAIFRPIRPLGCFFSLVTHQIVFAIWI